jgi:hypothetical protein
MCDMNRTFILTSAHDPEAAARATERAGRQPDICVVSPSDEAHETAAFAVGGRYVFTVEEPLLTARNAAESGADVLARLAGGLRAAWAYEAQTPLVVCGRLDILGATAFVLDEDGVLRLADALENALLIS